MCFMTRDPATRNVQAQRGDGQAGRRKCALSPKVHADESWPANSPCSKTASQADHQCVDDAVAGPVPAALVVEATAGLAAGDT